MPFCHIITYSAIELFAPGAELLVLKKLIDFFVIEVEKPVQDTQRFLKPNCLAVV